MSKRREPGERYALIPLDVLCSEAWSTLDHLPRTVLTVLAGQYAGTANGVQKLSRHICEKFGLAHSRAMKAARVLEERGLIVCTYRAKYTISRARIPSQWALAWIPITHRNNDLLVHFQSAPDRWRHWKAADADNIRSGRKPKKFEVDQKSADGWELCTAGQQCGDQTADPASNEGANTADRRSNPLRISGCHPKFSAAAGGD